MEFPPERSRPLHNFTLPTLRWGYTRHLRCIKINHTHHHQQPNPGPTAKRSFIHKSPPGSSGDCEGIEAIREKVMSDLRVAANRIQISILEEKEKAGANEPNSNSASVDRPCNLRTRRAVCKEPKPMIESHKRRNGDYNLLNKTAANTAGQRLERGDSSQRRKFLIGLTRGEIDSDFLLLTGKKPPRRPKKRARIIQKQVDACFPGLWLSEMTLDTYKVPDLPDSGKQS